MFEKGEIENYMNCIEGRFQDIEEKQVNGAYKVSYFCKKMTQIQKESKLAIQYTNKNARQMNQVEFQTQTGNLGQSILNTPTESSIMPQKLSSLDGSLIDQKMGMGAAPRVVRKKEEVSDLSGDIQVMNRFNDHLLQPHSSLKTLEKLESVDI